MFASEESQLTTLEEDLTDGNKQFPNYKMDKPVSHTMNDFSQIS